MNILYLMIVRYRKEKAYLLCAGNGIYEGGGFKMLPDANPSDSKLKICLITKNAGLEINSSNTKNN